MRRMIVVVATVLVFLPFFGAIAGNSNGIFRNSEGAEFQFIKFGTDSYPAEDPGVIGKYKSQTISVDFSKLRKVVISGSCGNKSQIFIVENHDGEVFELESPDFHYRVDEQNFRSRDWVQMVIIDPISKDHNEITINRCDGGTFFISNSGQIKINPRTKDPFPEVYVFDPYTGEKLVWGTSK